LDNVRIPNLQTDEELPELDVDVREERIKFGPVDNVKGNA
jgi:hypothetical protein